jgi:hypothetical protein
MKIYSGRWQKIAEPRTRCQDTATMYQLVREIRGYMLNLFGHVLQMPGKQTDRMFSYFALLGMYLRPLTIVFELCRKR